MTEFEIDRAKLRAVLRKLSRETIYYMLDEAIGLLPKAKLERLARRYISAEQLRPDAPPPTRGLLAETEAFALASRRGDYFETFNVNSKNCTQKSSGTLGWIVECNRLMDRCVLLAKRRGSQAEPSAAFGILFDLLRQIDLGEIDIVFFADEAGSWQVGIDWSEVLPAWFTCFARQAVDDETYEHRVAEVLDWFGPGARAATLIGAREVRDAMRSARRRVRTKRKE